MNDGPRRARYLRGDELDLVERPTRPPGHGDQTGHDTEDSGRVHRLVRSAVGSLCGARPANHDRVLADDSAVLVADGVGGSAGGNVAATLALTAAAAHVAENLSRGIADAAGAVLAADHRVHLARFDPELRTVSSTLTVVVLYEDQDSDGPVADLAWLGDSTASLLRAGQLQQLTRPHTGSQALAEGGYLSYTEVARHALASSLLDACGSGTSEPESLTVSLRDGDRILVASDGLASALDVRRIGQLLSRAISPSATVAALLEAAEPAAADNVTVAVAFVEPFTTAGAAGASGPLRRARAPRPSVPDRVVDGGSTESLDRMQHTRSADRRYVDVAPTTPLPQQPWSGGPSSEEIE